MNDMEIWKPVHDYEQFYAVSNFGNIKSLRKNGKNLKGQISNSGYLRVDLYKNKCRKQVSVHRIVAESFVMRPEGCECVNHKDENKLNNCAENLEWCSLKYNNNYGEFSPVKKMHRAISKPVLQYTIAGEFVARYASACEAQRCTGIHQSCISDCCNKRRGYSQSGGYVWKFERAGVL